VHVVSRESSRPRLRNFPGRFTWGKRGAGCTSGASGDHGSAPSSPLNSAEGARWALSRVTGVSALPSHGGALGGNFELAKEDDDRMYLSHGNYRRLNADNYSTI
jgi:hypothetical protein